MTFFNEILRSPNVKECFSFALGSLQFCPKGSAAGLNLCRWAEKDQVWSKYLHPRVKLKHV